MPNYQLGKIYKITSGNLIYIGSTCEPSLSRRLSCHKKDFKRWKDGKRGFISSFTVIESENYEITLVELCPCNSRDELHMRERFHIEKMDCVNKKKPMHTPKEWRQEHKEELKDRMKEYYQDNKETLAEKRKDYVKENKDLVSEQRKKWYETNKEMILAKRKEKYQLNKIKKETIN